MRVLQFSYEFPPLIMGGISTHVEGLTTALAKGGHEVVVITRSHPDAPRDSYVNGVRVVRVDTDLPWIPDDQPIAQVSSANHELVKATQGLGDFIPDVVHAHDWLVAWAGDLIAKQFKVPMVATIHATEKGRQQGHISTNHSYGVNAVEWWLTYQAQEIICCSKFMESQVVASFELPTSKITVIPNGIDPEIHGQTEEIVSLADRNEKLVVAWGRLVYEKGFQTLIEALPHISTDLNIRVVIAGRGPYGESLVELARQLEVEDRITFAGFISPENLSWLLQNASCAVIPSIYEPFGMVLLEAMAVGVPSIVSATGGLVEVVGESGCALTVPPSDPVALANQISTLLSDPTNASAVGIAGRTRVRQMFAWDAISRHTADVYEQAIKKFDDRVQDALRPS